eukprot:403370324
MQTPQTANSQNQQIPLSNNITIPLYDAQVNPLSHPPSADVNQSKKSQSDIEPFLNIQGPPSPSSQPIEQNLKVVQSQSSTNKMVGQDAIKIPPEISTEQLKAEAIADQKALEEKKKALEDQEKLIQKYEKLKEMKPFLDDFLQAEDFFTDVVPDNFKEGSKFRVLFNSLQSNSWYIQDDFIFSIEPKEWDNEDYFDTKKVKDNIELFFKIEDDNIYTGTTNSNRFLRTRKLTEKTNESNSIKSNFCLRIYSLTGLQLILSYDLSISHLQKNFRLQVYDKEYLYIICDDFLYYITFSDLMIYQFGDSVR